MICGQLRKVELADIAEANGQFDKALRIRQDEEWPAVKKIGHPRELAVTCGKIANILEVQGKLDEAVTIRREMQLPALRRVGDERELALCRMNMAPVLFARNRPGDREEAVELLRQAEHSATRLGIPELGVIRLSLRVLTDPDLDAELQKVLLRYKARPGHDG